MSESLKENSELMHRLNVNGGDATHPLRKLIGEAHDEIARLLNVISEEQRRYREAVNYLHGVALGAISYVGAANYAEREREARQRVNDAADGLLNKPEAQK